MRAAWDHESVWEQSGMQGSLGQGPLSLQRGLGATVPLLSPFQGLNVQAPALPWGSQSEQAGPWGWGVRAI